MIDVKIFKNTEQGRRGKHTTAEAHTKYCSPAMIAVNILEYFQMSICVMPLTVMC